MATTYNLDRDDVVLIIIDFQEKLMKAMPNREIVYRNSNLLLKMAELMSIPVLVTEQYTKGLGHTVEEISSNFKGHQVIEKMSFSAFDGLQPLLVATGRQTVLITGSETHVCVFQTTRDLAEAGYKVQVVSDAVCSRFEFNYRSGLELMKDAGAVITNTETVLFDLLKVAGTPEFKVISPLLK
jgi:nicotinamidase-related amidase